MNHDNILETLLSLRNTDGVYLVAKAFLRGTTLKRDHTYLILPDMHLMTRASAKTYKYSFHYVHGNAIGRPKLLKELCKALETLRNRDPRPTLSVLHLGDLIDVWRENELSKTEDLASMAHRVLQDNPEARDYLVDRTRIGTHLLRGNHDRVGRYDLMKVPEFGQMKKAISLAKGEVIITHGDYLDPIEELPDPFSRWGSRFTRYFGNPQHNIMPTKRIRRVEDIPAIQYDVKRSHPLLSRAQKTAEGLRQGNPGIIRKFGFRTPKPARLMIIGHTHEAKITSRKGLVIMDCGAWIGGCKLSTNKIVQSCQVGVIVSTGTGLDLRIYQLTPQEA